MVYICQIHEIFPTPNFSRTVYYSTVTIIVFIYSVVLSMAVYSDSIVVSGDEIATLINQNKETFSVAVSDAVVGKSPAQYLTHADNKCLRLDILVQISLVSSCKMANLS